MLALLPCIVW